MSASRVNLISAIIAIGVLAGCGAPRPPKPVNARLEDDSPYSLLSGRRPEGEADVVILARCKQLTEYAKTTKGDWETHWYFANWEVMKVIQGRWDSPNLTFIFTDRWPTPESGIMLMKMPLLYVEGKVFEFSLDMSRKVPLIVAQEERSRVPPHEALKRPTLDYRKPDDKSLYEQVVNAAAEFLRSQGETEGGFQLVEEFEDFFVVEHCFDLKCEAVMVDKDTYEVRRVDSASTK